MRSALIVLALALGLSCGPSGGDGDAGPGDGDGGGGKADARGPDAGPTTCLLQLSGAVTGSIPCTATGLKLPTDDFTMAGAISTQATGSVSMAAFTLSIPGEIAVRDYVAADLKSGAATITTVDSKMFAAATGTGPAQGTIGQLRVTSLEPLSGGDTSAKAWTLHGSFSATLVGTTTGGMVTLSASF